MLAPRSLRLDYLARVERRHLACHGKILAVFALDVAHSVSCLVVFVYYTRNSSLDSLHFAPCLKSAFDNPLINSVKTRDPRFHVPPRRVIFHRARRGNPEAKVPDY